MNRQFVRMPNGQLVSVPADITPDRLAQIKEKYKGTRVQRREAARSEQDSQDGVNAAPTPFRRKVDQVKQNIQNRINPIAGGNLAGGFTFNFDDELFGVGGALAGIPRSFKERSFTPIIEGYRINQTAADEVKSDYARDNPGKALAAQLVGGSVVPIGGSGKGLYTLAQGARGLGLTRTAGALGRTAARMRSGGAISRGVTVGATVGALNAAGEAKNIADVPEALLKGGAVGGAFGGVLGGTIRGTSAVIRTVRDRGKIGEPLTEASRARAYQRVGSLIDNIRDANDKPIGASQVINRINSGRATGADTRLLDQSPGLRSEAAFLGNEINLPNSNRLQDLAESRIDSRQSRFVDQVSNRASTKGIDVRDLRDSVEGARKAAGNKDYAEGGAMDNTIQWTPQLNSFFREAGPTTQAALRKAYDIMLDERRNPIDLGVSDSGTFTGVPSFRTLDYLSRGYKEIIDGAIGSGNKAQAARISSEFNGLKSMLVEQNPEYAKILGTQRDAFQRLQATELGERIFKEMSTKPRELLRELKKIEPSKRDDARIGIIDKLLNLESTSADAIAAVRRIMRSPPQRKILEFAFGGKKEVDSFQKYIEAELQAALGDRLISQGRQSATRLAMQTGKSEQEGLELIGRTGQGYFFGGIGGGLANLVNTTRQIAGRANPQTQNEIARILMSKGDDLEDGLRAAAKFFAGRVTKDRRRSARAARTVATPLGVLAGE